MEVVERPALALTPEAIQAVNEILHRRNQAEIKVERQQVVVVEIHRKKRI